MHQPEAGGSGKDKEFIIIAQLVAHLHLEHGITKGCQSGVKTSISCSVHIAGNIQILSYLTTNYRGNKK